MNRKLIYGVLLLAVLALIIVPAVYSHHLNGRDRASVSASNSTAAGPGADGLTSTPGPTAKKSGSSAGAAGSSANVQTQKDAAAQGAGGQKTAPVATAGKGGSTPAAQKTGILSAGASTNNDNRESGCRVGVAVVGENCELLYGPADVTVNPKNRWGLTALGALDATGLSYNVSTRWSGFIEAITGQNNHGQAGWMYVVNGQTPMVAADQHPVKAGDKVIWWYSKSMGSTAPAWDGLLKRK
ncbi:DUF4430 domain-containing protein [Desulfotomaculum copahuensis]|uniref:Transcobalamin-like C-terminal domain-containing protein n=1 Tax=Desulfotomaculum copahuensis TaxID=1838280 RepID=A0A1B7LDZ0_9FIRM|nr:DUF4430 domain-containing protein [Desulfotomaculum copahuensis]OAT81313.1 hypothetical protein A6M21_00510 [Desulfotomaculum copahuensis]